MRRWLPEPPIGVPYLSDLGRVERYMGWAKRVPKPKPEPMKALPAGEPKDPDETLPG